MRVTFACDSALKPWLGKVWGFLKYHHPTVTSGQVQWDEALLAVLPQILAARTQSQANTIYLTGYGNDRFYLALSNEAANARSVTVTQNARHVSCEVHKDR